MNAVKQQVNQLFKLLSKIFYSCTDILSGHSTVDISVILTIVQFCCIVLQSAALDLTEIGP